MTTSRISVSDPDRPVCHDCSRPMMRNRGKDSKGRQRYRCFTCNASCTAETAPAEATPLPAAQGSDGIRAAVSGGANRFVVTTAMNNSPVNRTALESLKAYCKHNNARLIVLPCRYKWKKPHHRAKYEERWDPQVEPYLVTEKVRIGPKLWVRGDVPISATAVNPSSGMAPLVGNTWSIFGHGQQSLVAVATPIDDLPNRFYTPGAVTQKRYSPSKAGAKAAFHHVTGALVVEVDGDHRFIRQVNICANGFTDLGLHYSPKGVGKAPRPASLVLGDEHVKFILDSVVYATFTGEDSIVKALKPRNLVRHDVLDMYAGSHHHEKSYRTMYAKAVRKNDCVRSELNQALTHLVDTTPKGCKSIVVGDSNHHDHLEQWLSRADSKTDHVNADIICELEMLLRKAVREGDSAGLFELYSRQYLGKAEQKLLKWINGDSAYMIGGVDHAQHGHRGANGARGSARGIANTTHKASIGHSHTAGMASEPSLTSLMGSGEQPTSHSNPQHRPSKPPSPGGFCFIGSLYQSSGFDK